MIGGQVGFAGHLIIGNNVKIQGQSGITKNLKDGEKVQGTPAMPYSEYSKSYVYFRNFPKIAASVEKIEKKLNAQNQ
jgi:UDP-3-O-[3-hydroxymyristoyl] glucosamine N-acyltransferase